jgi:hypothetical protein
MPDRFEDELVDYLAGELDGAEEEAFEEALFETPGVASRVQATLQLQDGIGFLARALGGGLTPVMPRELVDGLRESGRRLTELQMSPGDDVTSPIPEDAEFLVGHLQIPEGTEGDLDFEVIGGSETPTETRLRVNDVPWDPKTRRVSVVCERHMAERDRVTCFRVLRSGESEPLAEYVIRLP